MSPELGSATVRDDEPDEERDEPEQEAERPSLPEHPSNLRLLRELTRQDEPQDPLE
jgi:hypothetical protein